MGGKKKTPTAPAAHAGTPDDSGGTEPEKQRSEDAGSDSDSRRREAALREADSSLHLRSREKVGTLNQTASDMPPFDAKMLCTYLIFTAPRRTHTTRPIPSFKLH